MHTLLARILNARNTFTVLLCSYLTSALVYLTSALVGCHLLCMSESGLLPSTLTVFLFCYI